ncbi:hypothetical protein KR222_010274 [Zaprionus bogoriensis]|nr:hypothetical protein KR222_010274 [Zaprionus bogoriensis]
MSEDAPADTPAPAAAMTTTAGAALFQANAYLTAAAVAIYSTRALWFKLRNLGASKVQGGGENEDILEDVRDSDLLSEADVHTRIKTAKGEIPDTAAMDEERQKNSLSLDLYVF